MPACCATRGASSSGVLPSSSVITGVDSVTGRCSRYSSMRPRQPDALTPPLRSWRLRRRAAGLRSRLRMRSASLGSLLFPHHPEDRADTEDLLDVAHGAPRVAQVGLLGLVGDEDEAGFLALVALLHRADRHAELLELLGDGAQHARAIGYL